MKRIVETAMAMQNAEDRPPLTVTVEASDRNEVHIELTGEAEDGTETVDLYFTAPDGAALAERLTGAAEKAAGWPVD